MSTQKAIEKKIMHILNICDFTFYAIFWFLNIKNIILKILGAELCIYLNFKIQWFFFFEYCKKTCLLTIAIKYIKSKVNLL